MEEILQKIDAMLENFEIAEAFTFCQKRLLEAGLNPQQQEMLALQTIRCVIHTVNLETLHGYTDENNILQPSERGKKDIELLEKYIFRLIGYLEPEDQAKIETMYLQVCEYVYAWFFHFMPYYVQKVADTETSAANTRFYQGYLCLLVQVYIKFESLQKMACIRKAVFPLDDKKTYYRYAMALADQGADLVEQARELAEDFPYFSTEDGKAAVKLLLIADHLFSQAVTRMSQSRECIPAKVLSWKKARAAINADILNMIIVAQGERQSLFYGPTERNEYIAKIRTLEQEIKEIELDYEGPTFSESGFTTVQQGGCYVATAVYGSYDCPQVWVLRRYRDQKLASTWSGRAFIRLYYAVSPCFVRWFGGSQLFKRFFGAKLDKMVARLQAEGLKDTPYADQVW
ncbi:MAG: hypothetical protein E7447_01090 [Ruminococcaceae bacterium]|nr:hypothetical protein [Oscillospiraceae bacterium]